MPLTRKGAATRRRIIEGAAGQIREEGVFSLRLEDVLARTATSKSQIFHYFPGGKDELLLAVARHEAARVIDDQQPELGTLTSWDARHQWRDKVVARYRGQGADCPLVQGIGETAPYLDADREAAALLAGIQDGVLILMTTGSITHPEAALGRPPPGHRRSPVPPGSRRTSPRPRRTAPARTASAACR
ncbi:TetR/AcrR family transcriptional regulator [Streptomyces sp. NPDC047082]|uniref:TetR/AcrR family transcriptional regulator n=1 Tax=Streptomyces sp. NPDC047082 TaxID=3155259 RepID=UPI0033D84C40